MGFLWKCHKSSTKIVYYLASSCGWDLDMSDGGGYWSHKQVAKWLKSKGRGKLRNYCTMCCRQFRDKKGLKNHMGSKKHLEKMREFNENPEFFLNKFSDEFEKGFLEILVRMYGNKQVLARTVYSEYCKILHHRHLNSTRWNEFNDFVLYLREKKVCLVKDSPKGYVVRYIPEVDEEKKYLINPMKHQKKKIKKEVVQESIGSEKGHLSVMNSMLKGLAAEEGKSFVGVNDQSVEKESTSLKNGKVQLNFLNRKKRKRSSERENVNDESISHKNKRKKMDFHVETETPTWLKVNLIVKVVYKKFEQYYKKKGKIVKVMKHKQSAQVEMLKSKDVIEINERHLETVIPKLNSKVMVVRGKFENSIAVLRRIDVKQFSASLETEEGEISFPYEDFCKFVVQNENL